MILPDSLLCGESQLQSSRQICFLKIYRKKWFACIQCMIDLTPDIYQSRRSRRQKNQEQSRVIQCICDRILRYITGNGSIVTPDMISPVLKLPDDPGHLIGICKCIAYEDIRIPASYPRAFSFFCFFACKEIQQSHIASL